MSRFQRFLAVPTQVGIGRGSAVLGFRCRLAKVEIRGFVSRLQRSGDLVGGLPRPASPVRERTDDSDLGWYMSRFQRFLAVPAQVGRVRGSEFLAIPA